MLVALIGLQFLAGLGVLLLMLVFAFFRRMRRNPAYRIGVIFGMSALLVSLAMTLVSIARKTDTAPFSPWFWQASLPSAWLGGPSETTLWEISLWALVILSNMGLYGGIGFAVGLVWSWIGPKTVNSFRSE